MASERVTLLSAAGGARREMRRTSMMVITYFFSGGVPLLYTLSLLAKSPPSLDDNGT